MPSDNTIQLIIIVSVVLLSLYYYMPACDPIPNEGSLTMYGKKKQKDIVVDDQSMGSDDNSSTDNTDDYRSTDILSESENDEDSNQTSNSGYDGQSTDATLDDQSIDSIKYRATGPNNALNKKIDYKYDSYNKLNSGFTSNVEKIFDVNQVVTNKPAEFNPSEDDVETTNAGAINYKVDKKQEEKLKYDINQFTPKQKNKDWFEVIDSIDVKNSQLINIYRPIGANTIGSSLKCASRDIRGNVPCPQTVVSPWLQSSVQPDHNIKSLC